MLLLRDLGNKCWECLCKPGRKMQVGNEVIFGDGELTAVVGKCGGRQPVVEFRYEGIFLEVLERLGKCPCRPTSRRNFRIRSGIRPSIPVRSALRRAHGGTAFYKGIVGKIREKGVNEAFVTLHVGLGTFRPVKAEEVTEHHMHSELCMMNAETANMLNETKRNGGRIICVGTTSCRTLESW